MNRNLFGSTGGGNSRSNKLIFGGIATIMGLVGLGLGYFFGFVASASMAQEAGLVTSSLVTSPAALEALPANADVTLEGVLENNALTDQGDLVAYYVERYSYQSTDSNGNRKYSWKKVGDRIVGPPDGLLHLSVGSEAVIVLVGDVSYIDGDVHQIEPSAGFVREGDLHHRGLRNGDHVTVLGTRLGTGGIMARRLFLGDAAAFKSYLETGSAIFRWVGLLLPGLLGLVLIAFGVRSLITGLQS